MTTRCTRCLLPSTYPGVVFDENGVCNHCLEYRKPELLGEELFLQKIRSKRGAEYDCVLGISGGKDSSYVAYLATKKYGLRALAVCYDFTFMVDLARRNIKAVCDSLGLELLVVRSSNNLERAYVRNHLMSLAATGTTWGQCLFCHYGIEAILYQAAQRRGVPFILSGVISSEKWWNPGSRTAFVLRRLKRSSLADKARYAFFQSRAYLRLVQQRRQFPIPGNSRFDVYRRAKTPAQGPETVNVFDYVEWNQEAIEKTLMEETGWQKPERSLSWRYDCVLEPLLDYTYQEEFGISSAGLYLCDRIRAGAMSREEAISLIEELEDRQRLDASLRAVLDPLEIPRRTQDKFFCGRT